MSVILENHREAIAKPSRKYSVQRLIAFGSAIIEDSRPRESDVDLLAEFAPIGFHVKSHAYFDVLDKLQRALGTKAHLVMSGSVRNAILARETEKTKRIIYAS